jgi:SAM-dependent methyltransferase
VSDTGVSDAGAGDARAGRGPFGRALLEHHRGGSDGPDQPLRLHSDLGEVDELPARFFFRDEEELGRLERIALQACRGRVLDVGAGAGVHALLLQERGHRVTAIDVVPEAVEVMEERGVEDARRADVFEFRGGPYDTVLLLLNGIGMAGTVSGLDRFLEAAPRLLAPGGQLLADSADLRPRVGADRREDGRYAGEVHLQLEYREEKGPPYPQLYVDPETLARRAGPRGWRVEVLARGEAGEYLARLTRNGPDG